MLLVHLQNLTDTLDQRIEPQAAFVELHELWLLAFPSDQLVFIHYFVILGVFVKRQQLSHYCESALLIDCLQFLLGKVFLSNQMNLVFDLRSFRLVSNYDVERDLRWSGKTFLHLLGNGQIIRRDLVKYRLAVHLLLGYRR